MDLPVQPPVDPMLSKLTRTIPEGDEWLYEPKWDGFRAIVFKDGDNIQIMSRDGRDLVRYFPEIPPLLVEALPKRCVVDGEIIITGEDGLEFDALLLRIHPAESRVRMLAEQTPASVVVFDVLALGSKSLMDEPFEKRRTELEKMLKDGTTLDVTKFERVMLTPQTGDYDEAQEWFDEVEALGLDGLIAKDKSGTYKPGKRDMIKVKRQRTVDCVVGGYRLSKSKDGVGSLLLGVYDGDTLHYVGHTSSFKAAERRKLLEELQEYRGESFGGGRSPGGPSRWAAANEKEWVSLRPELVCEVSYDKLQNGRIRHAATFIRWRDDKKPAECDFDQFET
jgi:ATP-dependent DNA ligase